MALGFALNHGALTIATDGTAGTGSAFNPGGVTGIWATQNTREDLWAGLERKETFATSGPRIAVRFYEYTGSANPCATGSFPQNVIDGGGVTMGGNMTYAPRFVVYALPDSQPFAEIDIVKASSVAGGTPVESEH